MFKSIVVACLAATAVADLRMASQPKSQWKTQQRNNKIPFQTKFSVYNEPSDFNYAGLIKQRDGGGYDNFLRSNIDNEQDRRDFNTEDGKDHLPFRSYETAATDASSGTVLRKLLAANPVSGTGITEAGNHIIAVPGEPQVLALRWNNPHSAELEVNIWIMNKGAAPFVVPVMKPTCSGEGYQDNVFTFTVPSDFNTVASCRNVGECVLQVFAQSVESRMYSMGTPLIVKGGTGAWKSTGIMEAVDDPAFNLASLRPLCLPRGFASANHAKAVIYKSRLSSDVYNHAFQNSDFSPYAGQQAQHISQNLQAACILKMTVGNFGELGKEYMQKTAKEARQYANKLDKKARNLIRIYETSANSIIEAIKKEVASTDILETTEPPAGSVICTNWTDQYDRKAGGRARGTDRHGGYCTAGQTCLCHQDCYLGYGKGDADGDDAYCAVMEPKEGEEDSGKMTVKEGSSTARIGRAAQLTDTCFRCAEVGSNHDKRQNTNTYVPSFQIVGVANVLTALDYVAPIHLKKGFLTNPDTGLISVTGQTKAVVQIYMATLSEMWDEFKMASDGSYLEMYYKGTYDKLNDKVADLEKYKFTFRKQVSKTTRATLAHVTQFKKLDAAGNQDKGYYASTQAWSKQVRGTGSSVAVPNTSGPLNGPLTYENGQTSNMVLSVKSGSVGGAADVTPAARNTQFKMPPPALPLDTQCQAQLQSMITAEFTLEGDDMDGLNGDAPCDDDAAVNEARALLDAACEEIRVVNITFDCDPYPEELLSCKVIGQNGIKPGQLFTNDQGGTGYGSTNSAAGLLPSLAVLALASLMPFAF